MPKPYASRLCIQTGQAADRLNLTGKSPAALSLYTCVLCLTVQGRSHAR